MKLFNAIKEFTDNKYLKQVGEGKIQGPLQIIASGINLNENPDASINDAQIYFKDINDQFYSSIFSRKKTDGSVYFGAFLAPNILKSNQVSNNPTEIRFGLDKDGNPEFKAPAPPSGAVDNSVATVDWIRNLVQTETSDSLVYQRIAGARRSFIFI